MCELAVESSNWLMVDSWEATQKEYTVTVQVLRSIKKRFVESVKGHISNPENVGVKLLCGADLVVSFTIPGVWAPEDVGLSFSICSLTLTHSLSSLSLSSHSLTIPSSSTTCSCFSLLKRLLRLWRSLEWLLLSVQVRI
jgi:galactokinase